MKHFFTKSLLTALFTLMGFLYVGAVDYISVDPVISPSNGYKGGPQGNIYVTWPGVELQMLSADKDVKTPVDPSFVEITVNGNPVTINPDMTGGGKIYVGAQYETDGASSQWRADDQLIIQLPDMFFFWDGPVKVVIKEGAVTSITGAVNKPITVDYTYTSLNYDAIWTPESNEDGGNVTFAKGEAIFYVTWEGATNLSLNSGTNPFYQQATDENNGTQTPASSYISIDGDKVKFDFSSFGPGSYIVCLPDGTVNLGNGSMNGEAVYNFSIVEGVVAPPYTVKVLPSESDWFDAFRVRWGDDPNQPLAISSEYASFNENSQKYVFNSEGVSMIQVKVNGTVEVPVLEVSIEEFQENEDSQNYPNAQLLVTLEQFETGIGDRYSLIIPAGIVDITTPNGVATNETVQYTFTLKQGATFELPAPKVTPEPGNINTLDKIQITWPATLGGLDLLNFTPDFISSVSVTENGNEFNYFTVAMEWDDEDNVTPGSEGNIFTINFDAPLDAATYVITIPEGFITVSDIDQGSLPNKEMVLIYTLATSGVEGFVDSDASFGVYNLQGVKVLEGAKATDLRNLSKGIYIVNGKKVTLP